MFHEVAAIDAKANLSELLHAVAQGQRYTILVRGKAVVDLVPSDAGIVADAPTAVAAMRAFNKKKE